MEILNIILLGIIISILIYGWFIINQRIGILRLSMCVMKVMSKMFIVLSSFLFPFFAMAEGKVAIDASTLIYVIIALLVIICGGFGWVLNKVWDSVNGIKKELSDFKIEMQKELSDFKIEIIKAISKLSPKGFVEPNSPVSINEQGKEIADEIGVDETINNHWDVIQKTINESNVILDYDIQEQSERIDLNSILTDVEMKSVKEVAFKNGVKREKIYEIFAVKIREKILKERGLLT